MRIILAFLLALVILLGFLFDHWISPPEPHCSFTPTAYSWIIDCPTKADRP